MTHSLLRRNKSFRNLWLGKTGSVFGDWFNQVALAQVTLLLSHSPAAMGLVLLCRALPSVLLGPLVSPLIDRFSKKRIMLLSDLLRAVFALTFAVAFSFQLEWLLYPGAILLGAAGILFGPTENAVISMIVAPKDLAEANAIRSGTSGIASIIGAVCGGLIASMTSPVLCFVINAASYLWSALCIYLTKWQEIETKPNRFSYFSSLKEGFVEASRNRLARSIILIGISWGIAGGGYYVLVPLLGNRLSFADGLGIGLLYAIDGVGVVIGAYLVKRWIGTSQRLSMIWYGAAYLVQAIFLALMAQFSVFWLCACFLLLMRICAGIIIPLDTYLLQTSTCAETRGRVFALHESTYMGVMQLSYLIFGHAFQQFGIPAVGLVIGGVSFLCGLSWLRQIRHSKERLHENTVVD